MIKNYTLKNLKKGIAIMAITLGVTNANAQTTDVNATADVIAMADSTYVAGAVTMKTGTLTHDGATFKLQITVTPSGTGLVRSNGTDWGVGQTGDTNTNFQSDQTDYTATVSNIEIVDFEAGGTGYTQASVSDLAFNSVTIINSQNKFDKFEIGANGATATQFGKGNTSSEEIPFNSEYTSGGGTTATLSAASVTYFSISTGQVNTASSNNWRVSSVKVEYTFAENISLSTDAINKNDKTLTIYPTVTDGAFYVNKEFATLEIINIAGQAVKTFGSNDNLTVSGLSSGVYIVVVKNVDSTSSATRLVVK